VCASLARRYRAQRSAFKGIGLVPLPPSLAGGFGLTSGTAVGTAIGIKAVAFGTAALVSAGVGTEVAVTHTHAKPAATPAPVKPLRARSGHAELPPAAVLVSASASLVQAAVTNTPLRTIPAKAKATSPASSNPPAQGPAARAAEAQPSAQIATPVATQQADAPMRDSTAARQQPQLSGGGPPANGGDGPRGLALGHGQQQAGQPAEVHGSSAGAPDHPTHPDHPAHPDNPGQGQGQGQGQGGQPTTTTSPDPPIDTPTVPDVTVPTAPDPPPPPTLPGNGTPPVEPPGQAKPPKPAKPGGNPHGSLLAGP
jgi:hypothetical protein